MVRDKLSIGAKLSRSLRRGILRDKTVYWSGVTDSYAAPGRFTREIWNALLLAEPQLRPRRVAVQTRFLPDRDLDLIREYESTTRPADSGRALVFSISVGTDREEIIRAWERSTPSYSKRLDAIARLCEAGLAVVATLSPLGPWTDLRGTLLRLKALGVAYVTTLFFKDGERSACTPSVFLAYLRERFPFLLEAKWQEEQHLLMQSVFGKNGVLSGQVGFASLAEPHKIIARAQEPFSLP